MREFESAALTRYPKTYVELAELLTRARTYIGNDSGPTHLAGIMGMATVALFGPTDPRVWKPLGPDVRVIRKQPIGTINVDDVITQISG